MAISSGLPKPDRVRPAATRRGPGDCRAGLGVVVIGRNEGERLAACLRSVVGAAPRVVYVDSGSTDGSVARARALGAVAIQLDTGAPFTPGRARNAGFHRLSRLCPDLRYVQFVDGDCELVPDWLGKAVAFLDAHPDVAAVSGRLRERQPERSIYHRLCAVEWELQPVGEAESCAGNALMRAAAFAAAGGFRPELMAGEEPELCMRLRAAGWRIWGLAQPSALHDAAMTRFGQWWLRSMRSGYASLQRVAECRIPPGPRGLRRLLGVWFWALLLPVAIAALGMAWGWSATGLLLLYPLRAALLCLQSRPHGAAAVGRHACYATFLVLGKFPRLAGQLRYLWRRRLPARPGGARLIDYKS